MEAHLTINRTHFATLEKALAMAESLLEGNVSSLFLGEDALLPKVTFSKEDKSLFKELDHLIETNPSTNSVIRNLREELLHLDFDGREVVVWSINQSSLRTLNHLADTISRLGMFQLSVLTEPYTYLFSCSEKHREKITDVSKQLATNVLGGYSNFGIFHPKVSEFTQILHEVHQVIRRKLALQRFPEGTSFAGVDFDNFFSCTGIAPIEVELH